MGLRTTRKRLGVYATFNFVLTAHHLEYDWIDKSGTREQQDRRKNFSDSARKLFRVLRDIANASKHWNLYEKNEKYQRAQEVTGPDILCWFSYFEGPVLYVEVEGARPSIPEIAATTMRIFEWLFFSENSSFPPALDDSLQLIFAPIQDPKNGAVTVK